MSALIEQLQERFNTRRQSVLTAETLIVQSHGTGQWIKHKLAEKTGISANIKSVLPASFIWEVYKNMFKDKNLPGKSPYQRSTMSWYLMSLIDQQQDTDFDSLKLYLEGSGDKQVRAFQLCEQIAALYDQYLVFRPDMILSWDKGKSITDHPTENWQRKLWQQMTQAIGHSDHRASLYRDLLQSPIREWPDSLPKRISLFGLSSLPPPYLHIFKAIAEYCAVEIYTLNPCEEYWGDLVSEKDIARRSVLDIVKGAENIDLELYLTVGNPLLSSMGKQGREFYDLLLEDSSIETLELFSSFESPVNLLQKIKQTILNLESREEFKAEGFKKGASDNSIQIHSCHSPMREVEVLYDQLQNLFTLRPELDLRDVIVMMPDVSKYTPFIQSVFTDLPYGIADKSVKQESPVINGFMQLIKLQSTRLTAINLLDLLEVTAIARKFDFSEDDLTTLGRWVRESGIRWGLDGKYKTQKWNLPDENHNTWQFGLERLILGYAMEKDNSLFNNSLPYDIEASEAELLGRFLHFVDLLKEFIQASDLEHTAGDWQALMLQLMDNFFLANHNEEPELDQIRSALQQMADNSESTSFNLELSIHLVGYYLDQQLSAPSGRQGLLTGGVTFCNLVPMRSLPFEVVCLLGMNDGNYPRADVDAGFNLMKLSGRKKGDRSKNIDDRYLFLEALLSAQSVFYISYEGKSQRNNKEQVPSVLVSELIDYIDDLIPIEPNNPLVIEHPLQPFNPDYFDTSKPKLISTSNHWFKAVTGTDPAIPFMDTKLKIEESFDEIELQKLCSFYRHPARYFLNNQLGVRFPFEEAEIADVENFTFDGLENFNFAESALEALIQGGERDDWQKIQIAEGVVLPNEQGKHLLNIRWEKAASLYESIKPLLRGEMETIPVDILADKHRIYGSVKPVYEDTLLFYRTGSIKQLQILEHWVKHLALNASGKPFLSKIVDSSNNLITFDTLPKENAIAILKKLVEVFIQGQCFSIPFHPQISWLVFDELRDSGDIEKAKRKAASSWNIDSRYGAAPDRYYNLTFDFPYDINDDFVELAELIYQPLVDSFRD